MPMKRLLLLFTLLVAALAITISTSAQTITTFDIRGNVDGIITNTITDSGETADFYLDANGISHAFVRSDRREMMAQVPSSES